MVIRKRASDAALTPNMVELLLTGTCEADPFLRFDHDEDGLRTLWVDHRAVLLAEWRRSGRPGQPWAWQFEAKEGHDAEHE